MFKMDLSGGSVAVGGVQGAAPNIAAPSLGALSTSQRFSDLGAQQLSLALRKDGPDISQGTDISGVDFRQQVTGAAKDDKTRGSGFQIS